MRADFFDKRDKFEKLRQNDVGASVIRFGEISPLWQNLKSLGQYFESLSLFKKDQKWSKERIGMAHFNT